MRKPSSFDVKLDVSSGAEPRPERPEPDTPFRIAILGDFSGRGNRGLLQPSAVRRAIEIDRDNFDEVLAKVAPELHLPVPDAPGRLARVRFRELDDFHPDRIFERVELFQALRQARRRLSDSETFAAAAAEIAPAPAPQPAPVSLSLHDLFERTVEATETTPPRPADDLSALVREIVKPHLVARADPRQADMLAEVDTAVAAQMRAFLRQPDFQALESAWRALFFLVRRVETGPSLKLCLIDVSRAELEADLKPAGDLRATALYKLLVTQTVGTPGAHPWAVLAGNYAFDNSIGDVELLARIAMIAGAAGAPFLAAADPRLAGAESFRVIREMPEARWIGLALPRFLLRLPYGKETDPIEHFDFEEFEGPPEHEAYLWANPAFACVCLLGQAFAEHGWQMRPGAVRDIDGLPAHTYYEDGEAKLKPCAEVVLTNGAADSILDAGLMPLLSFKGRDAVRLARFQSVADPPQPIAGRWGQC